MLGPKWREVGPLLVVLGISGLVQPIANTTGWLFITQGRTNDMFKFSMIVGPITALSIIIGLRWGAIGVATSYVCARLCVADPILYWYVGRRGPVRTIDFYRTMAPVAGASLCGGLASLAFRAWFHPVNRVAGIVGCAVIVATVTLLVLVLIPAGRQALADLMETLRLLVGQTKKPLSS